MDKSRIAGTDKFVLGNASGSFYKFGGNNDFANITDFTNGEQIQLGAGDVYAIERTGSGFDIFAVQGGTGRDLIANVSTRVEALRSM